MTKMDQPSRVLIRITPYYQEFVRHFDLNSTILDDFYELIRQVVHELLNKSFDEVLQSVGVVIPETHRMRDRSFATDVIRSGQLVSATGSITAMMIHELKQHNLFFKDGTLPYFPRDFKQNVVVLDFITD